jgi:hypothetical protein
MTASASKKAKKIILVFIPLKFSKHQKLPVHMAVKKIFKKIKPPIGNHVKEEKF